jgi:DNA polymerase-3 subunit epsilon
VPTGKFFHVYLNPERKIPEDSIRIHKITDNFVVDKPLFADVVEDFISFLESSSLVIHNAEFDIKFLQHELQNINFPMLDLPVIDTLVLAREKYP